VKLDRRASFGLSAQFGVCFFARELQFILKADFHCRIAPMGWMERQSRPKRARYFFKMKILLNKVIEAKKASEANLISRREELAAIRSQLNSARLMKENSSLMRLRELEVLEKVAGNSRLKVVLGDKGLADRIVNML
jgi:hypothetical protein